MPRRRIHALPIAALLVALALAVLPVAGVVAEDDADAPASLDATAGGPEAEASGGAIQTVDDLHAGLLEVMKQAEELGYAGREARLREVVPQHFDVDFMARKSLGRYWDQADESGRARYLEVFERFMVANYAGRFDGWSGQSFEVEGKSPAGRGTVLVTSQLRNPADEDVELKYRLRPVDGGWKIIDVFLDGTVSELALRRSEFVSIVKREDLDALIAALDERCEKLASGG